jgi:aryl carrier-like protein
MVPSYFVELDQIPLTSNGKIDRKALPKPKLESSEDYVAPRNEIEEKLVHICSTILGVDRMSINDNFFNLGGDSIKTIQIQARMNKAGYKLSVKDIFNTPVISELSSKVKLKESVIDQGVVTGKVTLTPIQKSFF